MNALSRMALVLAFLVSWGTLADYLAPSQLNNLGLRVFLLPKEVGKPVEFTFDKSDRNGRPGADSLAWTVVSPTGQHVCDGAVRDDGDDTVSWVHGPRQEILVQFTPHEVGVYEISFPMSCDASLHFDHTRAVNVYWGIQNGSFRTGHVEPIHAWFWLPATRVGEPSMVEISSNYLHYSRIKNMVLRTDSKVFYNGFTGEIPPKGENIKSHLFQIDRTSSDALYELTADEFYVITFAPRKYPPLIWFFDRESALAFQGKLQSFKALPYRLVIEEGNVVRTVALEKGGVYRVDGVAETSEIQVPSDNAFVTLPEKGTLTVTRLAGKRPAIILPEAGAIVGATGFVADCLEVKGAKGYRFELLSEGGQRLVRTVKEPHLVLDRALAPGVWQIHAAAKGGNAGQWTTFAVRRAAETSPLFAYLFEPPADSSVANPSVVSFRMMEPNTRLDLYRSHLLVNGAVNSLTLLDDNRAGIQVTRPLQGKCDIKACLFDVAGNYSEYEWCFFANVPAEKKLSFDSNGYLHFNGRPFLPLIMYPPTKAPKPEWGFNTVLPNTLATTGSLEYLLARSLKSLDSGCVYRGFYTEKNSTPLQDIQRYMAGPNGTHPARLGAWMDEPDAYIPNGEIQELLQAYRSHGLDSGVAGVCCTGRNRYGEMAPLGDYLMIDIYPRAGVLSVNRFFNLAKSCANGKPIWQLNQGFDYDSSVALEKDFTPSVHQARYAHWATLRHGLQGVGLYNCGPKDYLRAFPRLFEQLSETYRQTLALSFAWVEPSLEGVLKHAAPLESRVVRHGGRVYAIVQNSSLEPQTARIQVNGQFQPTIRVLYENRTLTLDKGRFQDVFQALDTRLYLLEE